MEERKKQEKVRWSLAEPDKVEIQPNHVTPALAKLMREYGRGWPHHIKRDDYIRVKLELLHAMKLLDDLYRGFYEDISRHNTEVVERIQREVKQHHFNPHAARVEERFYNT